MAEENQNQRITDTKLKNTMRDSFLDYAMSVIVARALPDVRDGLKPVHRRILYAMNEAGLTYEKPFRKSATTVGEVMGKYHPHGDSAIYESMVRMAQTFSFRYPLIDGHGNFGNIDGDSAAAMRYTESRLSRIALEMVRDLNSDTVDFVDNFDGQQKEPVVLPSRFPNLLANGVQGIAVGMATNIPPHNLSEIAAAVDLVMKDENVSVDELIKVIPGPDFPTGGIVMGKAGIRKAYETGRGSVTVRAKVEIKGEGTGKEQIIVRELPYMTNKLVLKERIKELANLKKIDGISGIKDLSSTRTGMALTIDIKREASASVVLNNLYKHTPMQVSFSYNMLALDHDRPKTMTLKEILLAYLAHQREVITRRTQYDLTRAEERAHILEGLRIALDNIDRIIDIIRSSQTTEIAKSALMKEFSLSDIQSQAILDMRLARLVGLERDKIEEEYQKLVERIADLKDILAKPERIDNIISTELKEIVSKYDDPRRTELQVGDVNSIEDEDLIDEENIILTLTHNGYIKRLKQDEFRSQNRGGRGVQGMNTHDDDFVEQLVSTSTHDTVLFFTNLGKVYKIKGYEVPEYGRAAKGIPVINLLGIDSNESVQAVINVRGDAKESPDYLFFSTRNGVVKRTAVNEFGNIRQNGLIAINLQDLDQLINVQLTHGDDKIIVATHLGYSASFDENDVRSMGRSASGVRGVKLRDQDYVVGAGILSENSQVLVITEHGYGKKTPVKEYAIRGRAGKGIKTVNVTEKNGLLAGLVVVNGDEDIMVTTNQGVMIRFSVESVSQTSRSTQGVRLIRLENDSQVSSLAKIIHDDNQIDTSSIVSIEEQAAEKANLIEENDD